jgi:hypothetical protein
LHYAALYGHDSCFFFHSRDGRSFKIHTFIGYTTSTTSWLTVTGKEGDTLPSLFGNASPTRAVLDLLCKGCLNCAMVTYGSIKRRLQLKLQVHPCIRLRFVAFPKSPSYYIVCMHGMSTPSSELQAIRRLSSSFKDYNPGTSNGPNLVPIPPAYIRDARYQGDAL